MRSKQRYCRFLEDMGHGKTGGVETNHHSLVDSDVEASAETVNDAYSAATQTPESLSLSIVKPLCSSGSWTGATKPDDPAIANTNHCILLIFAVMRITKLLIRIFRSNTSHGAPSVNGTSPAILDSVSLDDDDDIEWEGKIVREVVVNGKLKFVVAWVDTLEPPENIGHKMRESWEAKKLERLKARVKARSRIEWSEPVGIKRGRGRPRKKV